MDDEAEYDEEVEEVEVEEYAGWVLDRMDWEEEEEGVEGPLLVDEVEGREYE